MSNGFRQRLGLSESGNRYGIVNDEVLAVISLGCLAFKIT
jgi:hypothetical protein